MNCFSNSDVVQEDSEFKLTDFDSAETVLNACAKQVQTHVTKLCGFCSELFHERKLCPARHTLCSFCHKPGHYRSACRRLSQKHVSQPVLSHTAFTGSVGPHSLKKTIVPMSLYCSMGLSVSMLW